MNRSRCGGIGQPDEATMGRKLSDRDVAHESAPDASLIDTLRAAAILGKAALGPRAGRDDPRVGQGTQVPAGFTRGKLCANLGGFSLHAAVRIAECRRDRLRTTGGTRPGLRSCTSTLRSPAPARSSTS
jgi:hypothetical protein